MSAHIKALVLRAVVLTISVLVVWPQISIAEETSGTESSSNAKMMTKEQKQQEAVKEADDRLKGKVRDDLALGVYVGASILYEHSNHRYVLPDPLVDEAGKKTTKKKEINKGKRKLGDTYENLFSDGVVETAVTVNSKLFDYLTPSTSFYVRKGGVSTLWDGEWNETDIPTVGVSISPHYFKPLKNDTLWKLLGIDSERNLGYLTYGVTYDFGYFYQITGESQLGGTFFFNVAHNNFDPLGPIQLGGGYIVRGTISSSASLVVPQETFWNEGAKNYLSSYGAAPSIRFSKTFKESGQLIAFGLFSQFTASRIPLGDYYSFDNFRNRTYQYQFVQFAYQKFWTRLSQLSLLARFYRDYKPPVFGKQPLDPSGIHTYQLIASFTWETNS